MPDLTEMTAVPVSKRRIIVARLAPISGEGVRHHADATQRLTNKSEPSAAELARLARQIEVERVHALFLDSITDPRAMERIAKETGAVITGTLYGDALSAPGGEAGTYIEMIRHDVATLKAGMLKN
jgi:zinc/manganese transport system substrate-binding protein